MQSMKAILLIIIIFVTCCINHTLSAGCTSWTGKMSGYLKSGTCPSPGANGGPVNCTQTPTYQQVEALGNLWPCPSGNNPNNPYMCTSAISKECTQGQGSNPLCSGFDFSSPNPGCCCNQAGCDCSAEFNWILSSCQGKGCGGYNQQPTTQKYKDLGSQVVVNYIASYEYDLTTKQWNILDSSSFNTDGRYPSFDIVKPFGGLKNISQAWLSPQPGGAADWVWGYYPAGVKGIEPPAGMFVLSTDQSYNLAFYMLNQLTLDRGPAIGYPSSMCNVTNSNCWASGNAGEMDFLENAWIGTDNDNGAADDYRRMFSTQFNQVGRCFPAEKGQLGASGGGFGSTNYFLGSKPNEIQPWIWAIVIDSVGFTMYRIPGETANNYWPGLTRYTAECTLQQRPSSPPKNTKANAPCDDSIDYCALFVPNCPVANWGGNNAQGAKNQGCWLNEQQGWCQNWWTLFSDTDQWKWPANGTQAVTHYANTDPVTQKWNVEMECVHQ